MDQQDVLKCVSIRKTELDDLKYILEMIHELIEYQKGPPTSLTLDDLVRDAGFTGSHPLFYSFIAEIDGKALGYTIVFYTYSTWEGRSLLLEDIYVRPEYRHLGVGKKLMQTTIQFAVDTGCSRVDLHVLNTNETARNFYKGIGATNLTETEGWLYYKFDKKDMESIIRG